MSWRKWVYFVSPPPFLRVPTSRAYGALVTRGVRLGADDQLFDPDGRRLSDADVLDLLHAAGIAHHVSPDRAALILDLALVMYVRELAMLKRDIVVLEWTLNTLAGMVDEDCSSPWRFKRAWDYLSTSKQVQKIDWWLEDLTAMARSFDSPTKGCSRSLMQNSKRLRMSWRKVLVEKHK